MRAKGSLPTALPAVVDINVSFLIGVFDGTSQHPPHDSACRDASDILKLQCPINKIWV